MGEVYRGRDTRLDRLVAIKILRAHLAEQPALHKSQMERESPSPSGSFAQRILNEAKLPSSDEEACREAPGWC